MTTVLEEAQQRALLVDKNKAVACVLFRGSFMTRRFRVGQRVEFLSLLGWQNGTVVQLGHQLDDAEVPLHHFNAYKIMCDNGQYATAPHDSDKIVRLSPDAPVVTGSRAFSDSSEVDQEIQGGFLRCRATTQTFPEKPSMHFCRQCQLFSEDRKLKVCGSCKVAVYCSTECQKEHWSSHKPFCQKIREELHKQENATGVPFEGHTKEQFLASMQIQDQLDLLLDFWTRLGSGMMCGGAWMLKNLVVSLVQKTMWPNKGSVKATAQQYLKESPTEELIRMFIHENTIRRLVAACLHFSQKAPGVAFYCSMMIQLITEMSHDMPVFPEEEETDTDTDEETM